MAKGTGLRTNLGKTARGIIHHLRPNLGKTAGDLLSKNCKSDQKFSSSTCSENGVAICSSGTKKGEVFLADVNTQPKQKNFKVDTSSRPSRQWRKVQDRLEDDERCSRLEKIDLLEEEEEEQRRIQKDQLRGAEDLNSVSDINLQASCSSGTKEGKVFVADFQLQSSVKTVVKFFESLSKEKGGGEEGKDMEKDGEEEDEKKKLALPGVHQTNCLTSCSKEEKEEVVKKRGRHQPKSVSSLNSRQRRYSSEGSSSATCKEKQLEITRPEPFKLQTEQRGKKKEEDEYLKRMCQLTKEEKRRIPIAQGVPLTTDEPEILIKPPVKDITRPLDSQLHSDARAVKRADFDSKIAEKLITCQEYKTGKNRREKAEEEEEVERLRKEQIPRALPMPSFDRPFIPKRSTKCPTIPKEPKFQVLHHRRNASSMF